MAGAGGAKSTLKDMIGYVKRLLNINNSVSIDRAFIRSLEPEIRINGKDYIGLGWEFYYTKFNKRIVVKDGGTGGFTAFVAFDKSSQKGIVALFNNDAENSPSRPFVTLLDRYFQE